MTAPLTADELTALRCLLRVAGGMGIPVVAVGATARWLAFNRPNGIPNHRTTTDWDFGVRVPDWDAFHRLRARLLSETDTFVEGRYEHELIHKAGATRIDLVPFGGVEVDGRIRWPGSEFEMNVCGFSEALAAATQVELSPDTSLTVATVPLLVALKVLAYADRGHETDRDLSDLWHVMRHYIWKGREHELFEPPLDSVTGEDFDWEYIGPLLLGDDVRRACNDAMVDMMQKILRPLTDPYSPSVYTLISRHAFAEREDAERREVSANFTWLLKGMQTAR